MEITTYAGSVLAQALSEIPTLQLSFYSYGLMLRKHENGQISEYAVDPTAVAVALAAEVKFSTGILDGNTLFLSQKGVTQTRVEYRPPQKTAIYLDGSDTPLIVPLPGMIMVQSIKDRTSVHEIYAVKERPTEKTALYIVPLPNVYFNGRICWGSVARPDQTIEGTWRNFLGSAFGNHSVADKSKSYPKDIREKLIELDKRKARKYPVSDMIATKSTFGKLVSTL